MARKMKAAIFVEKNRIVLDEKPVPDVGPLDALIRITTTTICGTDVHILKGEYPVSSGLTIGHEPVGVIEKLGSAVEGYREGQRVIAGAITPSGHSAACMCGCHSQDGAGTKHGFKAMGGWRFGNTIDGSQAEYLLVPDAMTNLAPIPDELSDEQVLMCPDIMSTGFSGAERGQVKIGDVVAVFAQGPIGLCATAGARLMGATTIIGVEAIPERAAIARGMGADHVVDFSRTDPVEEIMRLTDGRGVDVAIEALGRQETFEAALRVLRPGGTLSSLGVYSGDLTIPLAAFNAGLGDHTIVTTLCPGGKERMRRLMEVIASGRLDTRPLVTHRFKLDQIEEAYELFANQRDGVLKVAITP
jgi:alcohol dehydrogenase